MDLQKLKPVNTTEVELIHPASGPTGITITVASKDSPQVREVGHAIRDKRLAIASRRGVSTAPKVEDIESESLSILVAAVLGWKGLEQDGNPFECTPENVKTLLTDCPWIRRQVDEAMGDETRFFGD